MRHALDDNQKIYDFYRMSDSREISSAAGVVESTSHIDAPFGTFDSKTWSLDGKVHISEHHNTISENVFFAGHASFAGLEMHFSLMSGPLYWKLKGVNGLIHAPMQHNTTYIASDARGKHAYEPGENYHSFDVYLPLDYLHKWQGESKVLDRFLDDIDHDRTSQLSARTMPVGVDIQRIINQILVAPFTGLSKRLYLESKIAELFAIQLQMAESANVIEKRKNFALNAYDREQIQEVASHIKMNLANPSSIVDLSRSFGVNEHKLKNGFKEIFGTTIFDYLQQVRMQEAKKYLLDSDKPIKSIAEISGYQHVSAFSVAFKKFYDFTPGEVRSGLVKSGADSSEILV